MLSMEVISGRVSLSNPCLGQGVLGPTNSHTKYFSSSEENWSTFFVAIVKEISVKITR